MPLHTTTLTERRKADRAKMADNIVAAAHELGAAAYLQFDPNYPREIKVAIQAPGGLCLNVDFNGESTQLDVHVLPWHMHLDSDAKLVPSFGQVNPHHHRKATHVAYGYEAMYAEIRRGLTMAADGSAYQQVN